MSSNTGSQPASRPRAFAVSKAEVKSRVREKNSISSAAAADFQTFFVDEEGASGRTIIATVPPPPEKERRGRSLFLLPFLLWI